MRYEDASRGEVWGIFWRLLLAFVILGGAYFAVAQWLGGRVPSGTSVMGVDIGGMDPSKARADVREAADAELDSPVRVGVGDDVIELDPRTSGLGLDTSEALSGLTGVSYNPARMWERIAGTGSEREVPRTVDRAQLERVLKGEAPDIATKARDASASIEDDGVQVSKAVQGRELNVKTTADRVAAAWKQGTTRKQEVEAAIDKQDPAVDDATIEAFVKDKAEPAASKSIRVKSGAATTNVTQKQVRRIVSVGKDDAGQPVLKVDKKQLQTVLERGMAKTLKQPVNARIAIVDRKPKIYPDEKGLGLDMDALTRSFSGALLREGKDRRAWAEPADVEAEVTAKDIKGWGIKEKVSEFRIPIPNRGPDDPRAHNIRLALGKIDGVIVQPDEVFSLLEHTRPFTEAAGYRKAGVIRNGRLEGGYGGGVSQVSTTLFNASFFAGVRLDDHTAHAYYIDRYPEGREATLYEPTVDNQFKNTLSHAIMISAYVEGGDVVVAYWGTKEYDVTAEKSKRTNIKKPSSKTDNSKDCMPQTAMEGFTVRVTRKMTNITTGEKRQGDILTIYRPSDKVTCTNK